MKKAQTNCLIGLIVSCVLMVAWIFVAVLLTGSRELEDFTSADKKVFIGFIAVELITVAVMFFFAVRFGKMYRGSYTPPEPSKVENAVSRRGIYILIVSFALASFSVIIGVKLGAGRGYWGSVLLNILLIISCLFPFIMLPLSIFLKKRRVKALERKNIGELQSYILSHRDCADKTAEEKLRLLRSLKLEAELLACAFAFSGLLTGVLSGLMYSGSAAPCCIVSAFSFLCAVSSIRLSVPKAVLDDDEERLNASEYRALYETASAAAKALGCRGGIFIEITPDCNISIIKIEKDYYISLGAIALGVMCDAELYAVFLHEFSHMSSDNTHEDDIRSYYNWLTYGGNRHILSPLVNIAYAYLDYRYMLEYELYVYASSIDNEKKADEAMVRFGSTEAAASALLKLNYHSLYSWEKYTYDEDYEIESGEAEKRAISAELERFKARIKLRSEDWNRLTKAEILSRSASHPTVSMRLAAFGVEEYKTLGYDGSPAYNEAREKALSFIDGLIYRGQSEAYAEARSSYFESKALVEAWEKSGKPIVAEEYAEIYSALRNIGRVEESVELCKRAIDELPKVAACFAYEVLGCHMLHCYDADGLEYLYKAMNINANYIDEALEYIGMFCCLTGNQEQLDIYRERSVEIIQRKKDENSQADFLCKNDRLTAEKLPDGMLEQILSYISSIEDSTIDSIYLVRKTVTDSFFTSAFVIRLSPDADPQQQSKVFQKIFSHLDTCYEWQFSLFDYADYEKLHIEKIAGSCVYNKE